MAQQPLAIEFEDVPLDEARRMAQGPRMDPELYHALREKTESLHNTAARLPLREGTNPTTMKNRILRVAAELSIPLTVRKVPGPPACSTRRIKTALLPEGGHAMICLAIWRAVRCSPFVTSLLCLVTLFCAAGITVAAVVGDQVELKATHQAGVPLHQEPRGTNDLSVTKNRG